MQICTVPSKGTTSDVNRTSATLDHELGVFSAATTAPTAVRALNTSNTMLVQGLTCGSM